jgi:uncharacterized membrane protein YdjX (TVP38/TMEM64 family)
VRPLRPLLFVLVVGLLVWASHHYGGASNLERVRAFVEAAGPYGPLAFIAVCIAGIFLHMPEILLIAVGGMLFEGVHAFTYGWIASVVGATSTFVIVRYFARDYVQRGMSARFARLRALDERLERNGFVTVLVLRLVLFMAPPLNWALGASRVRLVHYVGGTALGVVPGIAAAVFFADSITQPAADEGFPGRRLIGAAFIVGFLVVAGLASRRFLDRAQGTPSS